MEEENEGEQKEVRALDKKDIEILKTYVCIESVHTFAFANYVGQGTLPQRHQRIRNRNPSTVQESEPNYWYASDVVHSIELLFCFSFVADW
jgi:hypothetical protein